MLKITTNFTKKSLINFVHPKKRMEWKKGRKISFQVEERKKEVSSKVFFALLTAGTATVVVIITGFIQGMLDKLEYQETPAQIVKFERLNENNQIVSYRYRFKHYLFEKTTKQTVSRLFGPSKLQDFKEGEIIKILASQRNPQLSCFQVPIFQPIGTAFFYDRRGNEIKQILPHVKELMEQRKVNEQKQKEKDKWKQRVKVLQNTELDKKKDRNKEEFSSPKKEEQDFTTKYIKGPFGKLFGMDYEVPEDEKK